MSIKRNNFLWVLLVLGLNSCSTEPIDDPIPYQTFNDVVINLGLPQYAPLLNTGGHVLLGSPGIRGVILYRESANSVVALERNCSFQPLGACATVGIHSSGLFLEDTCCGSTFDFNGTPTGAPAFRPLNRYATFLSGNSLTITDTLVQ